MSQNKQQKIISLCKRRGFVYPSSEIYGGLANVYDYGPMGVELLNNIKKLWWQNFVHKKENIVGIESSIFMHPKVWEASGHVEGFHDPLVDCKECRNRYRADHLIEDVLDDVDPDDYDNEGLAEIIRENEIKCSNCGEFNWTDVRNFNLMFDTHLGPVADEQSKLYLRPETAQGMFVQFNNVLNTTRQKIPFGIAQIGKAFRNEITKGNFVFRTLEFEQMEIEYFIREEEWEETFDEWREEIESFYYNVLGISENKFRWKPHHPDKLSHYAKKAEDLEYEYSTGFGEVSGLHYRTDFDLSTHEKHSGKDTSYYDQETEERFTPHVVESTFGPNRILYMVLDNAYVEEDDRVYLKLPVEIAPYRAAVFPLVKNKEDIVEKARGVYEQLVDSGLHVAWDERGNIGKRYMSQDEIGTPYCITIDYDTLEDDTVTIRDRDSMDQKRVSIDELSSSLT